MFYTPHFRDGRATLSFDVRLEPGALVAHEWRDAAHPYRVGPSVRLAAGGKLVVGGKPLADLPTAQWFHVEIACELGAKATGRYNLTVTLPGEPPKSFHALECGSAKFNRLEWLGFVSSATETSVFYLDNVKLRRLADEKDE